MTIQEFIESEEVCFQLVLPNTGVPNLLRRYPWMLRVSDPSMKRYFSPGEFTNPSWKISFANSGLPLRVEPWSEAVEEPYVSATLDTAIAYRYISKGILSGQGKSVSLSSYGRRYVELMMLKEPEEVAEEAREADQQRSSDPGPGDGNIQR
jgi:hypothetical protein